MPSCASRITSGPCAASAPEEPGNNLNIEELGHRWDGLLAVDKMVHPRVGLTANYIPENDLEIRERWSLTGIYLFNKTHILRFGGGKDRTFFVNYVAKWDR